MMQWAASVLDTPPPRGRVSMLDGDAEALASGDWAVADASFLPL